MSVTYTATLPVSDHTVLYLSGLLHAEPRRLATRAGTLRSAGRDAMKLEHDDKVLTLPVELGAHGDLYYLPECPRWDDGSAMPAEIFNNLQAIVTEIEQSCGLQPEFRTAEG